MGNVFLVFNVCFNILIVYMLKYGSSNVLFLSSTVMLPIANMAFALPSMPGSTPIQDSDIAGLLLILLGLVTYRFGNACRCSLRRLRAIPPLHWRRGKMRRSLTLPGEDEFNWDAPVLDDDQGQSFAKPLLSPLT